jgi:class 3 adenylate cyclase
VTGAVRAHLPYLEVDGTFLIADLAGFTALTEIHGSRYAASVVTRFVEIVRETLDAGARLVEWAGDAVLVVASHPASAVRTALGLRDAIECEPRFPLLHLGVHGGRVVQLLDSYFGTPLDVTARLAAHAAPGQILCTGWVATAARDLEAVAFRPVGPVSLRNILRPVEVFEVLAAGRRGDAEPVDPVCWMRVDPPDAVQLVHAGRVRYFCSPACARTFAAAIGVPA